MRIFNRNITNLIFLSILFISMLSVISASHADVKYTMKTKVQLNGTVGDVVSVLASLAGGKDEFTEKIYIQGNTMRID